METEQALQLFEQYLQRRYGDRSTPKHYMSDMHIFFSRIQRVSVEEVTACDIDDFIDWQHARRLAPTTINRRLATLHTFFEFLAAQQPDDAQPNPVNWRRHRLKEREPLPRDASEQEVETLFAVIESPRDAAMFGLMVGAGLRVEEVASIRITDLERPASPEQMARLRVRGKGHKERIVWITPRWFGSIQTWLTERPVTADDHLFLNQHRRRLSKDGIQYWLRCYCAKTGVTITCHQLRHTFARRLAEQRMPIESISKLLGHSQVVTTQRYTAGADPDLQDQFQTIMAQLEIQAGLTIPAPQPVAAIQRPKRQEDVADLTKLDQGLARFSGFPPWLQTELAAYTHYRWRGWKPHLAGRSATRLTCQLTRAWTWLLNHREINGWADVQRSDIEQWLDARRQDGLSATSLYTELCDLRAFLRFVENRSYQINPAIYRIATPACPAPLPKHLTEDEYERLVKTVLAQTSGSTLTMTAERAWFLTLAHTGMRVNEMLDLRLADLDLNTGRIFIASPKNRKDRIAFITPALAEALQRYLALRLPTDDDHLWRAGELMPNYEMIRRRLHKWGKLCGVSVTAHRLRHTFATRLLNRSMSLESIRKLLGHTSLQMSQHYARLYDSTVKTQFELTSAALDGIAVADWPAYATTPFLTQTSGTNADSV